MFTTLLPELTVEAASSSGGGSSMPKVCLCGVAVMGILSAALVFMMVVEVG